MIDFEAILKKLEEAGVGKIGQTLHYDTMPISVRKGVCVRSNISGDDIDYEIPGLGRGEFRLIARSAKYQEGEKLLLDAIKAIRIQKQPVVFGKMRVRYCRPVTTPMSFPLSDGNLREFAVRMQICYDYDASSAPWFENGESSEDKNERL